MASSVYTRAVEIDKAEDSFSPRHVIGDPGLWDEAERARKRSPPEGAWRISRPVIKHHLPTHPLPYPDEVGLTTKTA